MRKHDIQSQIDSKIPAEYIQKKVNIYTVIQIRKTLEESGLPKEVKLNIVDKMIEHIKNST